MEMQCLPHHTNTVYNQNNTLYYKGTTKVPPLCHLANLPQRLVNYAMVEDDITMLIQINDMYTVHTLIK